MNGDMCAYMNTPMLMHSYSFYENMLGYYTHVLKQPLPPIYEDIRRYNDEDMRPNPPRSVTQPRRRYFTRSRSRCYYDTVPTEDTHCDSV